MKKIAVLLLVLLLALVCCAWAAAEESKKPAVSYKPGFSLKRLFWACVGGAFLGGLLAGSVITVLLKILF